MDCFEHSCFVLEVAANQQSSLQPSASRSLNKAQMLITMCAERMTVIPIVTRADSKSTRTNIVKVMHANKDLKPLPVPPDHLLKYMLASGTYIPQGLLLCSVSWGGGGGGFLDRVQFRLHGVCVQQTMYKIISQVLLT